MRRMLRVLHDRIPPSDNHIRDIGYRFIQGRKRAVICYTKEAENYKKDLVRHINNEYFLEVQAFARGHQPTMLYQLSVVLTFPESEILNKSWLQTTRDGERKALSPYKRLDTMNRRKLLEDCLSEAIGIDDSLFWEGGAVKLVSTDGVPSVALVLEEVDPETFGVPAEYLRRVHGR